AVADAHPKFDVALVTPNGAAFDGEAEMVVVPGAVGDIGVLARHAPPVATLRAGSTPVYLSENDVLEFATGPGFFKVGLDRALAPAEGLDWFAEHGPPIDVLLTNRHHYRSSALFVERFGATVHAAREGMHEFSDDQVVEPFDVGDGLPGGIVAHAVGAICPDET